MNCQNLFFWENKNNIISLSSAEFAPRLVKFKHSFKFQYQYDKEF